MYHGIILLRYCQDILFHCEWPNSHIRAGEVKCKDFNTNSFKNEDGGLKCSYNSIDFSKCDARLRGSSYTFINLWSCLKGDHQKGKFTISMRNWETEAEIPVKYEISWNLIFTSDPWSTGPIRIDRCTSCWWCCHHTWRQWVASYGLVVVELPICPPILLSCSEMLELWQRCAQSWTPPTISSSFPHPCCNVLNLWSDFVIRY